MFRGSSADPQEVFGGRLGHGVCEKTDLLFLPSANIFNRVESISYKVGPRLVRSGVVALIISRVITLGTHL